jgi:hypothetical protein
MLVALDLALLINSTNVIHVEGDTIILNPRDPIAGLSTIFGDGLIGRAT